jgi:hypothetical protein
MIVKAKDIKIKGYGTLDQIMKEYVNIPLLIDEIKKNQGNFSGWDRARSSKELKFSWENAEVEIDIS